MFNPFKRPTTRSRKSFRSRKALSLLDLWTPLLPRPLTASGPKPEAAQRTGLAETVRRVKAGGMPEPVVSAPGRTVVPRGASFRTHLHSCDFGERRYKLYIPASVDAAINPPPLVVMLHGCGQSPDDFARGTRMNRLAEELHFLVLYPEQPAKAQASRCWNWYRPADQIRDSGEPGLIASLTRQVIARHHADPARVYVAGLSAGASAALILAAAYPDLFAAAGAHSGLPVGAAHDAASGLIAMRQGAPGLRPTNPMPTIIFHGDADKVVNPRNGRYVEARALVPFPPLRKTVRKGRVSGGHEYVRTSHRSAGGRGLAEHWVILGAGHAWSGGSPAGSFTDPAGPDASREMLRFFLRHRLARRPRST